MEKDVNPGAEPQAHHYVTQRTARYYTLGGNAQVKKLWIVLHGYGMLPQYWVRKFEPILSHDMLVVAPEGLSRYYLQGDGGRVGASWMTREDRLSEIVDQRIYLDGLLEHICAHYPLAADHTLTVFGFSQGVATAWRWVRQGRVQPHHLVLWAGGVPQEPLPPDKTPRLVVAWGTEDPYLPLDQVPQKLANLDSLHYPFTTLEYLGGHTIPGPALISLAQMLYGNLGTSG